MAFNLSPEKRRFAKLVEQIKGELNQEILMSLAILGLSHENPQAQSLIESAREFYQDLDEDDWSDVDLVEFARVFLKDILVRDLGVYLLQMADGVTDWDLEADKLLTQVEEAWRSMDLNDPEQQELYALLGGMSEKLRLFEAGRKYQIRQKFEILRLIPSKPRKKPKSQID